MPSSTQSGAGTWYRSPIDSKTLKELHRRSDWLGLLQTGGYLGILALTGTAAYLSAGRLPIVAVIGLFLLHGVCCSFISAAVHELSHGTVFKTKALNSGGRISRSLRKATLVITATPCILRTTSRWCCR